MHANWPELTREQKRKEGYRQNMLHRRQRAGLAPSLEVPGK